MLNICISQPPLKNHGTSSPTALFVSVRYDGLDVPDTMNVHGVYDTSATIMTYESREEYQKHLQQEAGVSGSYFGFSAGVKQAWGESKETARQKYMAVLDIDIERCDGNINSLMVVTF